MRNHCNLSLNFYSVYRIIEACELYLSNMHQIPSKTTHRARIVEEMSINWQDSPVQIGYPSYEIAKISSQDDFDCCFNFSIQNIVDVKKLIEEIEGL